MAQGNITSLRMAVTNDQSVFARSSRRSLFTADDVQASFDALALVGVSEQLETWHRLDQKGVGGRPSALTFKSLLAVMLMLQTEHAPQLVAETANVFYRRLTPDARELLGIAGVQRASTWQEEAERWYHRTSRCFQRMLSLLEPRQWRKQLTTLAERRYQQQFHDSVSETTKRTRLDWVCNALLEMTFRELPAELRDAWAGDITIDRTKVPAVSKRGRKGWTTVDGKRITDEPEGIILEPDADWYSSEPQYKDLEAPNARDMTWAYAANIAVMVPPIARVNENGPGPFPRLAIAMRLSTPIRDKVPAETLAMLASIRDRRHPAGRVTADKEYFAQKRAEDLALPVRALGYSPVTDYRVNELGVRGHIGGAIQVEGKLYCPAMPKALIDASKRHAAGETTEAVYLKQVEQERPLWETPRKEAPDANGAYPVRCPALGPSATVYCPLRRNLKLAKRTPAAEVTKPPKLEDRDRICTQTSVQVVPDASTRYLQELRYGTREWSRVYRADRADSERMNGIVKDGAKEDLENAAMRRTRGFAAAALFTALAHVSANRRMVATWQRAQASDRPTPPKRRRTRSLTDYQPRLPTLNADGTITLPATLAS